MARYSPLPSCGPVEAPQRAPGPCVRKCAVLLFAGVFLIAFGVAFWPGDPMASTAQRAGSSLRARMAAPHTTAGGAAATAAAAAPDSQEPQQQQQQQQQLKQRMLGEQPLVGPARPPAGAVDPALPAGAPRRQQTNETEDPQNVLLELFVMSQCPDANYCEHAFEKVLKKIHPIVTVRTEYIQRVVGDKLVCKHGDTECAGNRYQLCVREHTPAKRNYDWFFKFIVCTWDSDLGPGNRTVVKTCLNKVGASKSAREEVERCVDGPEGDSLMKNTAAAVKARGIQTSCTAVIDGAPRCVRDGGEWRDCPGGSEEADFVTSLCDAYEKKNAKRAAVCRKPARRRGPPQ